MILLDDISLLKQYNLCYREPMFMQPVVYPRDIILQGALPDQYAATTKYSINVELLSCDGLESFGDVTSYFNYCFAVSIYNQKYFNIQADNFGFLFTETFNCFILHITVRANNTIIFDKVTEPYYVYDAQEQCYIEFEESDFKNVLNGGSIRINSKVYPSAEGIEEDGYKLVYDYLTSKVYIYYSCDEPITVNVWYETTIGITYIPFIMGSFATTGNGGCKLPLMKIQSNYNCYDKVGEYYFGDPLKMLNIDNNNKDIIYTNTIWLYALMIEEPGKITRETDDLNNSYTVKTEKNFLLESKGVVPSWLMREVEDVFSGRDLYVNGINVYVQSDTLFVKDEVELTCSWSLQAVVSTENVINDFTCVDDCTFLCTYFVIHTGKKDQAYYTDSGKNIGYYFNNLMGYFKGLKGVESVEDVPIDDLPCVPVAILKVSSFGVIPAFFYAAKLLPANKVYQKRDECTDFDVDHICQGISKACTELTTFTETVTYVDPCPNLKTYTENVRDIETDKNMAENITKIGGWDFIPGEHSLMTYNEADNTYTLELHLHNPNISPNEFFTGEDVLQISNEFRPSATTHISSITPNVPLLAGQEVWVYKNGYITIMSNATLYNGHPRIDIPLITFKRL